MFLSFLRNRQRRQIYDRGETYMRATNPSIMSYFLKISSTYGWALVGKKMPHRYYRNSRNSYKYYLKWIEHSWNTNKNTQWFWRYITLITRIVLVFKSKCQKYLLANPLNYYNRQRKNRELTGHITSSSTWK